MKRSDRSKAKKKKQREERLRREKHARASAPRHYGEEDELDEEEPLDRNAPRLEERALRRRTLIERACDQGRLVLSETQLAELSGELSETQLAALTGDALDAVAAELVALDPREAAQELAFQSSLTESRKQARVLARQAIELDPDCTDALSTLAILDSRDDEERIRRLEASLAAGERSLGGEPFFERNRGRFWSHVFTRPYIRTRESLAELLRVAGRTREAAAHFEAMLELDRDDGLGVLHSALGARLELGELDQARALLDRDPEKSFATHLWARALGHFLSGDRLSAARTVRAAREQNEHVEDVLLRLNDLPEDIGGFTPGMPSEALEVELRLGRAWRQHPQALEWLGDGATATTPEEQEAAVASYRPPVSDLLETGEPAASLWHHDDEEFDLSPENVAELERMVLDRALHELELDDPAVWAPLLALRVLARGRPVESLPVFLSLAREVETGDETMLQDLSQALALAGEEALDPCASLLADATEPLAARMIAVNALARMAMNDTDLRERTVDVLIATLSEHERAPRKLNDLLAANLIALHTERADSLIR